MAGQTHESKSPISLLEREVRSRKSTVGSVLWFVLGILVVPFFDFVFFNEGGIFSENAPFSAVTRCWRSDSNLSNPSDCSRTVDHNSSSATSHSQQLPPEECVNGSVWSGKWDLNPNISKPLSKIPADIDMAQRYHSDVEVNCNMTDVMKLSVNEVIAGHVNDATELLVVERLDSLKGKTLLQIGTSVDNRNLRFGCPLFGVNRNVVSDNGISVSSCQIPLIDFTLAYTFNDALTMAHTPVECQEEHLKKVDELLATSMISRPQYVLLSGIEWDFKWYKENKKDINWNYTYDMVEAKVKLFRSYFSDATAIFLRSQPFLIGSQGSLAAETSFEMYNNVLREVVQNQRANTKPCSSINIADMEKLMLYNGTEGWSDGVHPAGWVSMQYLGILLNVMSLLGRSCAS